VVSEEFGLLLKFIEPLCHVFVVWSEVGVKMFHSGCEVVKHIVERWVTLILRGVPCGSPNVT
jgi:hypothetical protein